MLLFDPLTYLNHVYDFFVFTYLMRQKSQIKQNIIILNVNSFSRFRLKRSRSLDKNIIVIVYILTSL